MNHSPLGTNFVLAFSRALVRFFLALCANFYWFLILGQIRLGSTGCKDRYYKEKFCAGIWDNIDSMKKDVVSLVFTF